MDEVIFCRHIKTNGQHCGSPAMLDQNFCYFHELLHRRHRRIRKMVRSLRDQQPRHGTQPTSSSELPAANFLLNLPPLEDPEAIQLALSLVVQAIASGNLDNRQGRTLLFALQLASTNVRRQNLLPADHLVWQVDRTPGHPDLAPPTANPRYRRAG